MTVRRYLLAVGFFLVWLATGIASLVIGDAPASTLAIKLGPFQNAIYGWHLACWMIIGMVANYFWDFFNEKKKAEDFSMIALFLPVLIAPIVFFAIWSLVDKDKAGIVVINMAWPLIAFQNGFFWQVVLNKAKPS